MTPTMVVGAGVAQAASAERYRPSRRGGRGPVVRSTRRRRRGPATVVALAPAMAPAAGPAAEEPAAVPAGDLGGGVGTVEDTDARGAAFEERRG